MEDRTMEPNKTTKIEAAAPSAAAGKPAKATKDKKAATKPKVAKQPKPKREKPPKEPLVVFAFRLSEADRTRIHDAAGSGKATRFVLTAALAAANGDQKAFDTLVESRASKK